MIDDGDKVRTTTSDDDTQGEVSSLAVGKKRHTWAIASWVDEGLVARPSSVDRSINAESSCAKRDIGSY